jgi:hypothetical protein
MVLSENEAKFKFCPMLKTRDDKMRTCLVSQCMFWRWLDEARTKGYCGMAGAVNNKG